MLFMYLSKSGKDATITIKSHKRDKSKTYIKIKVKDLINVTYTKVKEDDWIIDFQLDSIGSNFRYLTWERDVIALKKFIEKNKA